MKTNLSSCCNAEVNYHKRIDGQFQCFGCGHICDLASPETNYVQIGEITACGHCDERFKEGLKQCEEAKYFKCECKCHRASPEVIEKWGLEFNREFVTTGSIINKRDEHSYNCYERWTTKPDPRKIKSFIRNILSAQEKELKEKIEELVADLAGEGYSGVVDKDWVETRLLELINKDNK